MSELRELYQIALDKTNKHKSKNKKDHEKITSLNVPISAMGIHDCPQLNYKQIIKRQLLNKTTVTFCPL